MSENYFYHHVSNGYNNLLKKRCIICYVRTGECYTAKLVLHSYLGLSLSILFCERREWREIRMVLSSLSILSSTSVFPSNSTKYSDLSPSNFIIPTSIRTLPSSKRKSKKLKLLKSSYFKVILGASSVRTLPLEDGSSEQFTGNNSIADFMRFKRGVGVDGGTGDLQTAVVSYKKKFPWVLLTPFLQVPVSLFFIEKIPLYFYYFK